LDFELLTLRKNRTLQIIIIIYSFKFLEIIGHSNKVFNNFRWWESGDEFAAEDNVYSYLTSEIFKCTKGYFSFVEMKKKEVDRAKLTAFVTNSTYDL
jgi:hypothetical protein